MKIQNLNSLKESQLLSDIKISSYIAQEAFNNTGMTATRLLVTIYLPLSVASYSFIQLSELRQRGVNEIALL